MDAGKGHPVEEPGSQAVRTDGCHSCLLHNPPDPKAFPFMPQTPFLPFPLDQQVMRAYLYERLPPSLVLFGRLEEDVKDGEAGLHVGLPPGPRLGGVQLQREQARARHEQPVDIHHVPRLRTLVPKDGQHLRGRGGGNLFHKVAVN